MSDEGYVDDYRGWYDTRGCGTCNDYCRWVGNSGSGGNPAEKIVFKKPDYSESKWACQVPYIKYLDYKDAGVFLYKKCAGKGAKSPIEGIIETGMPISINLMKQ